MLPLTDRTGIAKTDLINTMAGELGNRAAGFYTEAIRGSSRRLRFGLLVLMGRAGGTAYIESCGRIRSRVSRHVVEVNPIERLAVKAARLAMKRAQPASVDEMGKQELF